MQPYAVSRSINFNSFQKRLTIHISDVAVASNSAMPAAQSGKHVVVKYEETKLEHAMDYKPVSIRTKPSDLL